MNIQWRYEMKYFAQNRSNICSFQGARTSCCVNMEDRRLSFIMYNLILFFCVYLIPLIILITTNTIIYVGLQRMKSKISHGAKADFSQKRIEMERRILKSRNISFSLRNPSLNFLQVSSLPSVVSS